MPNKNNTRIFHRFYIPMLLLSLISSLLIAFITVELLFYLSTLTPILYIILGILSGILGIIIPAITGPLIIRAIYLKKIKKSQEKITSSSEYQELLKEIKKIESSLDFKKSLQKTEEKNINDIKTKYNFTLTEITMKETLLRHLDVKEKNSSNNVQNEEKQEKINVLKRVKKKRLNKNGKNYYHFLISSNCKNKCL